MDLPSAGLALDPEIRWLYDLRRGMTRLGLASTRNLLRALGHPERALPMLHVTGTNGKGSTTALAAAMLQAGGLRVGRYTSPHILHVEERICVDGIPMDGAMLRARIRELRPLFERTGVSFFEAMTALAALHFRDTGADVAVYEVGLGGRLDATNAIPSAASIISSIGHDHERVLGRGLRAVCREKLGIAKRGVPLFAALDRADLVALARAHCAARRTPLTLVPPDVGRVLELDLDAGTMLELRWPQPMRLRTRFLGAHQVRNVALAAAGCLAMRHRGVIARDPDLIEGAARAFLPGRFQVLPPAGAEPLTILDTGHNPEALDATLDVLEALLPGARPTVVLGLLDDKRLGGAAARLAQRAGRLVLTAPGVARAWDARRAAKLFPRGAAFASAEVAPDVAAALALAATRMPARDGIRDTTDAPGQASGPAPLLVLGSHYLLAEAVPSLAARRGVAPEALLRPPADEPLRAAS